MMDNGAAPLTPQRLAALAETFPAPIVRFASGPELRDRLATHFFYSTRVRGFGERFVLVGGLLVCAAYVERVLRKPEIAEPVLSDHVSSILFDRGYDRGLACSVLQRAHRCAGLPFAGSLADGRPVTEFILEGDPSPGNLVRHQAEVTLEDRLARLFEFLSFMKQFEFAPGRSEVRFQGGRIELEPFLWWDGKTLHRLAQIEADETPIISYRLWTERGDVSRPRLAESEVKRRLTALADLWNIPSYVYEGRPRPQKESSLSSVMPLFEDSYPVLNRLAEQMFRESQESTKRRLWLEPVFADDVVAQVINDEVTVTNLIIRRCLKEDPVTLLRQYFSEEPKDERVYLEWLLPGKSDQVDRIQRELDEEYKLFRDELRSFYANPEDWHEVEKQARDRRTQLLAQRIVKMLDFPVQDERPVVDIVDHERRVQAFYNYLCDERLERDLPTATVIGGFMSCCRAAESILRTLILFYNALRLYDPRRADGLSDEGKSELRSIAASHRSIGLGRAIHELRILSTHESLREPLQTHLERDEGIWPTPAAGAPDPLASVERLNEERLTKAHYRTDYRGVDLKGVREAVRGFLSFIQWLREPTRDGRSGGRIYPATLSLDVVTTNRCGILSVNYVLKEVRHKRPSITLYTSQPLSVDAGTFYGLPSRKALADLWVNPVLFPVRAIPHD